MTATPLVVEFVLVGLQALAWIALLIGVVAGYRWLAIAELRDWIALITLAVLGASYTVGLILDWVVRTLLQPLSGIRTTRMDNTERLGGLDRLLFGRRRAAYFLRNRETELEEASRVVPPPQWLPLIRVRSADAAAELDRRWNQLRLLAASILNPALIGVTGIWLALKHSGFSWGVLFGGTAATSLVVVLALLTWKAGFNEYHRTVRLTVIVLASEGGETAPSVRS